MPIADLKALGTRQMSCSYRESNRDSSVQSVPQSLYHLTYPNDTGGYPPVGRTWPSIYMRRQTSTLEYIFMQY